MYIVVTQYFLDLGKWFALVPGPGNGQNVLKNQKTLVYFFSKNVQISYLDRKVVMKSSRIGRILMKICWNIEKDVPNSILEAPGADSGVKNKKNKKKGPHPARSQNPCTGILFFLIPGPPKKMKVLKKIKWIRPPPAPGSDWGGVPAPFFQRRLP